jgi:guanylate kinase
MKDQQPTTPSLKQLTEFEELLKDYTPSKQTLATLKKTPLVLLVGPTAAGRNTLINLLTTTGRYHYCVSDTTRPKRYNKGVLEQDGREYWFISEEKFLEGLKSGEYIEAAVIHKQQVSGVHVKTLIEANQSGKIAVTELTPEGGTTYHKLRSDALFIFLLPPSFDVWMQRLRDRGGMNEVELYRRLESALKEIARALADDFYHFVINNEIHEAAVAVDELANGRAPDEVKQALGRGHAEQLAIDIKLYLQNK